MSEWHETVHSNWCCSDWAQHAERMETYNVACELIRILQHMTNYSVYPQKFYDARYADQICKFSQSLLNRQSAELGCTLATHLHVVNSHEGKVRNITPCKHCICRTGAGNCILGVSPFYTDQIPNWAQQILTDGLNYTENEQTWPPYLCRHWLNQYVCHSNPLFNSDGTLFNKINLKNLASSLCNACCYKSIPLYVNKVLTQCMCQLNWCTSILNLLDELVSTRVLLACSDKIIHWTNLLCNNEWVIVRWYFTIMIMT